MQEKIITQILISDAIHLPYKCGSLLAFNNKENVGNKGYVMQLIWIKSRKIRSNEMNKWLNELIKESGFSKFVLITKTDKSMDKTINEDILY